MPSPEYRKKKPPKIPSEHIPPDNDPVWRTLSQPLLTYLETPHTWEEIDAWRKTVDVTEGLCRNMLIWLDMRHLVKDRTSEGQTTWRAVVDQVPAVTSSQPRRRPAPPDEAILSRMLG